MQNLLLSAACILFFIAAFVVRPASFASWRYPLPHPGWLGAAIWLLAIVLAGALR